MKKFMIGLGSTLAISVIDETISLHQTRYGTFCFNAITSDHHYGSTVLNISYIPCQ